MCPPSAFWALTQAPLGDPSAACPRGCALTGFVLQETIQTTQRARQANGNPHPLSHALLDRTRR
jgi:hypothetical protein